MTSRMGHAPKLKELANVCEVLSYLQSTFTFLIAFNPSTLSDGVYLVSSFLKMETKAEMKDLLRFTPGLRPPISHTQHTPQCSFKMASGLFYRLGRY